MYCKSPIRLLLALTLLAPAVACAQDAHRDQSTRDQSARDQIAAANARAISALRDKIAAEPIGRDITVGDLLGRTHSDDTFLKTLSRAQQIGGPRWIDAQTCQVRLDISGQRVAVALENIAAGDPSRSPIATNVLTARLRDWNQRTFSATATSTGAAAAEQLRPIDQGSAWAQVDDSACHHLIAAAKQSAIADVSRAIAPIALGPTGATVGDEMKNADVQSAVQSWMNARPVTQVEFADDLSVRVTLATPVDELFNAFASAARKRPELSKMSEADWQRAADEFATRVSPASHGSARAAAAPSSTRPSIHLTAPPDWIDQQIDAQASAASTGSKLKTARSAEHAADAQLRDKISALPLSPGINLAQAAATDTRIKEAIDRAIDQARPTKVEYLADGGAKVRVTLNLADLWQEIQDLVR